MIWFDGTIKNAVDKVKATNSLLLVFVQGEDDLSKEYDVYLSKEIEFGANCTAIKIEENSTYFEQFKKIYHTVPVPSVFLIGSNGIPLTIVCSKEPSDFSSAVKDIIAKQKVLENQNVQNSNAQKSKISLAEGEGDLLKKRNSSNKKDNIVRIQFRLPSNEICFSQFPDMCTLHDVKLYLTETLKLGPKIKLFRTYPRIAFTQQDEEKTLTDLLLTPNAALIVVPCQDEAIKEKFSMIIKNNVIITFVMAIFQPIFTFISLLKNYISRGSNEKDLKVNSVNRRSSKKSTSNIHGFTFNDKSDSDSDMNTDNGNSTQQK